MKGWEPNKVPLKPPTDAYIHSMLERIRERVQREARAEIRQQRAFWRYCKQQEAIGAAKRRNQQ